MRGEIHNASSPVDAVSTCLATRPTCRYSGGTSIIVCAAIDVDRLSGDEASILADEEQAGRSNFLDAALPAERDAGGVRQLTLIPFWIVAPCIDAAGRNHINPDVMVGEFRCEPARHADQAHLRCR